MNRTLRDISHLFLSEAHVAGFPPSPPSGEPTFDPERIFVTDQFFPSQDEWEQILQWHRLCRALVAGMLVRLGSTGQERALGQASAQTGPGRSGLLERVAKGVEGPLEGVDLQAAVQQAVTPLRSSFVAQQTRYVETLPERMPRILGVPALLAELLEHLLRNSLEAVAAEAKERRVWLSLEFTPQEVFLTLGDNGEGLTSEVLARMFFPFFTTRRGIGLGLFWVTQILELHQGRLKLWSQPGIGTEVYLRLPTSS